MELSTVGWQKEQGVATITLNRPRALNALNAQMIGELLKTLERVAWDGEVKVLVLTGAGRAFCFGADPAGFESQAEGAGESNLDLLSQAQRIIRLLATMPKPVIAALNGFATGLGLDLALACDLRIAAERAKLGEAFVTMGLVPDGGGTFFLPRLVGLGRAAEMIFTGEPLTAAEAERLGLINRVVPMEKLEEATREMADKLARGPSLAIALAKRLLRENLWEDLDSALRNEAEQQRACLDSSDHREAVRAFREKRRPVFRGK
ncbi:MAG: enoyl-CoA hydratase [Deltaproteobacteria bacterium]|nr:enoyl-CoA hydratase [Deltaproteobacteria bacterium]